ncbi:MAG: NADH:ubiquinone reductase (Na(+)-transporting) subunit E [Sodaliphilus sp.]|jgi:Na+-transporting NADH:ubiquinone oxidoreductase subunit E|nr:NADH:ubiquinone reductase (Na(+)-transporting) subunit E [Muribaculaceae bacterium]MCI6146229.1 NADH:ubiquinone reductase (Na(+)-transporting) subunit E [Bacteroidales bacterium]MDY2591940.1 NADH:ubiquinone reductase (Na(+)-transporting) subunit E [Sodaliphilus sp.]MCI6225485.1 NADH:ubiquinone reductase (Na(+)-transporting) subunit E [Bacteroidales bacterium]MCI6293619.1 NADH:ubiquinone reductase (Na(+)-transporting) subunit E [Bacteroidales bacterium]
MEELNLFVKSIFVDNMIFAYFLGMCSYLAVSKNVKTAFGLGVAVTFMLIVTLPLNYLLDKYILQPGALAWLGEEFKDVDLSFLGLIMFIAVIASATQLVEMAVEKFSPSLYNSLGIFLPLIAVNCAILGGALFMQQKDFSSALTAGVYGAGSGIGWLLAIVGLAAIREKLAYSNVPKPLRGIGITFIITGLMGIAFMSFLGIKL